MRRGFWIRFTAKRLHDAGSPPVMSRAGEKGRGGGKVVWVMRRFQRGTRRLVAPLMVCCQAGPSGGRREDCSRGGGDASWGALRRAALAGSQLSSSPSAGLRFFSPPWAISWHTLARRVWEKGTKEISRHENKTFGQPPGSRWRSFVEHDAKLAWWNLLMKLQITKLASFPTLMLRSFVNNICIEKEKSLCHNIVTQTIWMTTAPTRCASHFSLGVCGTQTLGRFTNNGARQIFIFRFRWDAVPRVWPTDSVSAPPSLEMH